MTSESPDAKVSMDAAERRSVGVVALISLIRMFGLFALLPVLALYARDLDGATPLLIGLAVGAYGLTQAGFQVPLGALSDRIGRIPVILMGLAIFAAGCIVAAMSETIYGLIAGRLLQGAGAISATLAALITDATRNRGANSLHGDLRYRYRRLVHGCYGRRTLVGGKFWSFFHILDSRSSDARCGAVAKVASQNSACSKKFQLEPVASAATGIPAHRFLRILVAQHHDSHFRRAAICTESIARNATD